MIGMASLKLNRIILPVHDLKLQLAFYHETLELPIRGNSEDPTYVELDAGGVVLGLQSGNMVVDKNDCTKMVFYTDDVATLRDDLLLVGIKVGRIKTFGDLHSCDAVDPEGN